MSSDRVEVTRRVAASAPKIFGIVANPAGHVEIDGSGMLENAPNAKLLTEVGETFDMDMDRTSLGDIPNMTKYQVRNTVTQIVPDRLIEWGVGSADRPLFGHVYGWKIEPVSDNECDVTNYCDWTDIPEEMRARRPWPIVPVEMLERSVENLQRIAASS